MCAARFAGSLSIQRLAGFIRTTKRFDKNTVLSAFFYAVHQRVGQSDGFVQARWRRQENGYANADTNRPALFASFFQKGFTDVFEHGDGSGMGRFRQEDHEFIPTQTTHEVCLANRGQ